MGQNLERVDGQRSERQSSRSIAWQKREGPFRSSFSSTDTRDAQFLGSPSQTFS